MSVPLDRLYSFLHDHCDQDVIIYRWYPHGSRKPEDCTPLNPMEFFNYLCNLPMICHDQEPLRFSEYASRAEKLGVFRYTIYEMFNFYDRVLLLHSEQRSQELEKFAKTGAIPVYYWSHALIAHDWYRYAQHDVDLAHRDPKNLFLIYNRAWTGTREYRLKFAEMLINSGIESKCLMGFNPVDQEQNYKQHQYTNPNFAVSRTDIQDYFFLNQISSAASADYCASDYKSTQIEVVLETLFDDSRWHLTEKALRPIACNQPFMLAATPGSLEYLRSYGFKTFAPYIDETYDTITDPVQRLEAIVAEMKRISNLDDQQQQELFSNLRKISTFNQQRFFDPGFFQQVMSEFKHNFNSARALAEKFKNASYFNNYRHAYKQGRMLEDYVQTVEYVEQHTNNLTGVLRFFESS